MRSNGDSIEPQCVEIGEGTHSPVSVFGMDNVVGLVAPDGEEVLSQTLGGEDESGPSCCTCEGCSNLSPALQNLTKYRRHCCAFGVLWTFGVMVTFFFAFFSCSSSGPEIMQNVTDGNRTYDGKDIVAAPGFYGCYQFGFIAAVVVAPNVFLVFAVVLCWLCGIPWLGCVLRGQFRAIWADIALRYPTPGVHDRDTAVVVALHKEIEPLVPELPDLNPVCGDHRCPKSAIATRFSQAQNLDFSKSVLPEGLFMSNGGEIHGVPTMPCEDAKFPVVATVPAGWLRCLGFAKHLTATGNIEISIVPDFHDTSPHKWSRAQVQLWLHQVMRLTKDQCQWFTFHGIDGKKLLDQSDLTASPLTPEQTAMLESRVVDFRQVYLMAQEERRRALTLGDAGAEEDLPRSARTMYSVEKLIGRGGTSVVFNGWRLNGSGQKMYRCALKCVYGESTVELSVGERRRLEREAALLGRVSSKHVVGYKDAFCGDDWSSPMFLFAMELLEGKSLDWLVQEGIFDVAEAAKVGVHVLAGLQAMHNAGIVHRDIKPANIVRTAAGNGPSMYTIIDLGVAAEVGENRKLTQHAGAATMCTMLGTGEKVGTMPYMSPEMYRDPETVGPRADVWSVAVTVFLLLSGTLPFEADEEWKWPFLIAGNVDEEPPCILSRVPEEKRGTIPDGIVQTLREGLQKKVANRIESAAAMRESLLACLPGAGPPRILAFFSQTHEDSLKVHQEAQVLVSKLQDERWVFECDLHPQPTLADFQTSLESAVARNARILHLAGHGTNEGFKFLLDITATASITATVEQVCKAMAPAVASAGSVGTLECVVINACYSETLGRMMSKFGVQHVVCWQGPVRDKTALLFSESFYRELASTEHANGYAAAFKAAAKAAGVSPSDASDLPTAAQMRGRIGVTSERAEAREAMMDKVLFLSEPPSRLGATGMEEKTAAENRMEGDWQEEELLADGVEGKTMQDSAGLGEEPQELQHGEVGGEESG